MEAITIMTIIQEQEVILRFKKKDGLQKMIWLLDSVAVKTWLNLELDFVIDKI